MKTIKFKIMLLLGALMSVSFTACGSSSDDEPDNGSVISNVNGHEAVDLGLSVRWASCNVGANKMSDRGSLYAWGSTVALNVNNIDYIPYFNEDLYDFTKYTMLGNNPDGKKVLELIDDAASVNWSSKWRTPTKEEMQELAKKCVWEYDYIDGTGGFTVKGPSGKTIFLPSGIEGSGATIDLVTREGKYWTSSTSWDYTNHNAFYLFFNFPDYIYSDDADSRRHCMFIRPVCAK